jgi:small ligand-binding sensory domain FIST
MNSSSRPRFTTQLVCWGGEIGPVGGKAFLHGFTATLAIFVEP